MFFLELMSINTFNSILTQKNALCMQFLDHDTKMIEIFLSIHNTPTLLIFQRYFNKKHPCKKEKKPKETNDNHISYNSSTYNE